MPGIQGSQRRAFSSGALEFQMVGAAVWGLEIKPRSLGEQSVLLFTAGPSPALQMYFKLNLILIVSRKLSD